MDPHLLLALWLKLLKHVVFEILLIVMFLSLHGALAAIDLLN